MSLEWKFEEHWWGESATYDDGAGTKARVSDCDGDFSNWSVEVDSKPVQAGTVRDEDGAGPILPAPEYHFDKAMRLAEEAIAILKTGRGAERARERLKSQYRNRQ